MMVPMKILTPALRHVVRILNDQQLHSGHDLSQALGISRSAVWKHINQLVKYGIEIEAIQSTGYRLKTPLCLLDEAEICRNLRMQNYGLELWGSVPSTNDLLKSPYAEKRLQFCLAEHQTAGRGRFNRAWVAPFGANILLSCRVNLTQDLSHYGGLSLCVGLAVIQALRDFGLEDLSCKWPNDILYRQQKLAGVLIELRGEAHGTTEAVIGIGCNINMSLEKLSEINRPTTSVQAILGAPQDRNRIAALLMDALADYIEHFESQGFSGFQAEWQTYDALCHQDIVLNCGTSTVTGKVKGVDAWGQLLLEMPSGEVQAYSAGEASLAARLD
jgi:BirA family biotin operon repressor/biotin-[acetyl-CoA-carboxylase] ligase